MATHKLTLPVDDSQVEKLRLGDTVYLSGTVYTARDMAHLNIKTMRENNQPLPVELAGRAIFHAGPVVRKVDGEWQMVVVGPTTSIRMEPYAQMVGELGVKLIIGKGGMSSDSQEAFKKYKQAYLQAAPGCAVLLAAGVTGVDGGHWQENGMPEAMWVLEVENFGPFIVTMDSTGESRYAAVLDNAMQKIEEIY